MLPRRRPVPARALLFASTLAVALSAVLAASLLGCGRGSAPQPPSAPVFPGAHVVVISVDTLRSDHLPSYGYAGVETPALSELRKDAVLFERAWAQVPLTLPSHATLFTGLPPAAHGIHDNAGYLLDPSVPTLAGLLKGGGYRTGGAVSAFVLDRRSGIARGFDFYEDRVAPISAYTAPSLVQRSGAETEALLESWIEAQPEGPLFAFLHLYEPHTPYDPPEPFRSRYASPYDGEIAAADQVVGRFLSFLRRKGIYEKALVVFLSDHGESLGEHGEDEHGIFLYRSTLQVPLLLKLPGGSFSGTSVAEPVALSDLFATIGAATSVPGFPASAESVSLVSLAAGGKAPPRLLLAETWFPRIHYGWAGLASAFDGTWHYVAAPRPEMYDLGKDPAEGTNLAPSAPGPLRAMKLALEKRAASFRPPAAASEEEKKKLASLGYLSTGATASAGALPDPKDEIGTVRLLRDAVAASARGDSARAIELFERLLAKNQAMADVWELYSDSLLAAGRGDEALAARRKTVELSPPAATIPLLSVANTCLRLGQADEALRNAKLALDRGDGAAHEAMARAYLALGDLDRARQEAEAGLSEPRVERRSRLALAHVEIARKDDARALEQLDRILVPGPLAPPAGAHYLRGDILARGGRFDEALPEFREEIRLYPGQTQARVGLAMVLASSGRMAEARRTVAEMVAQVGSAEAYARAYRALVFFKDRGSAEEVRARGLRLFPSSADLKTPL